MVLENVLTEFFYMSIAVLFTVAKTRKKPRCPSTKKWIKNVVHIYNGILLSQKKRMNNAIEETWMDLEIITLRVINQTEKDKYHYDIAYVQNILK